MTKLIFFLLLPVFLYAQVPKENSFRFQLNGAVSSPLNSSKAANNNLAGKAIIGGGGGYLFAFRIKNEWYAGLNFNILSYTIDEKSLKETMYKRYQLPGHYTTVTGTAKRATITNINFEIAYKNRTRIIEIEPFVRIGVAMMDGIEESKVMIKRKNSNYTEYKDMGPEQLSYAAASLNAGLRFFKKISRKGGIAASVHYAFAPYNITMKESTTDYLGTDYPGHTFKVYQPFHALQYELGIQFRFYKKQAP